MTKKVKSYDGFTLAELLIVVAIIAVLVAVSIPIFTRQLEKARESTDLANMRAAKAAIVTAYLNGDLDKAFGGEMGTSGTCYYDAAAGIMRIDRNNIEVYGKGTSVEIQANKDIPGYITTEDYQDAIIVCTYDEGKINMGWMLNETDSWKNGSPITIDPDENVLKES